MTEAPSPAAKSDWINVTVRLATSWVGLFTAYVAALILGLTKYKEFTTGLQQVGLRPWIGIVLIAIFPVLALLFSTIPSVIERRRIKRYADIKVDVRAGYFTLRPRETEQNFERVDQAHEGVLRWIKNSREPVLYLTGASGTGKSSVLAAWVMPKLTREDRYVVIALRGYERILERTKDRLLTAGIIWAKPPGKDTDLRTVLERACERLGEHRRLVIVIDQFEEFLILKDEQQHHAFQRFLSETTIQGLTFVLVYRPEYEGLIQDQSWPRMQIDTNRKVISAFTENAANEFLRKSGLTLSTDLMKRVLREAAEIEQGATGLIRPVTINLCGLVLSRFAAGLPRKFRGGIIRAFLRESLQLPEVRGSAEKIIPHLITDNVTKRPRTISELAQTTRLEPFLIRGCMQRLGESDRAIVRPLDEQQEVWEISHDFLVPLLDAIVARRISSVWQRVRPWMPWAAAAALGIVLLSGNKQYQERPECYNTDFHYMRQAYFNLCAENWPRLGTWPITLAVSKTPARGEDPNGGITSEKYWFSGSFAPYSDKKPFKFLISKQDYLSELDLQKKAEFRPEHISILNTDQGLLFTAVWVAAAGQDYRSMLDLSPDRFSDEDQKLRTQGFVLTDAFVYRSPETRIAAIWVRRNSEGYEFKYDLSKAQFKSALSELPKLHYQLTDILAYTRGEDYLYGGIWEKGAEPASYEYDMTGREYEDYYRKQVRSRRHPYQIVPYGDYYVASVWHN